MTDKNFHQVTFKVNAAGSWAKLLTCDSDKYDQVKDACEVLAKASLSRLRFKVVDADGGTIEEYGPSRGCGISKWHSPAWRRDQ